MRLFSDEIMIGHDPMGPERPDRLRAIHVALGERTFDAGDRFERAAVERVHPPWFVDEILSLEGKSVSIDPDTQTSPESVDAIRCAVGCSLAAARAAMAGEPSFALVRPPGHHAERERAMGFCFFNNIAVAAEEALALGAQRVMIVDWDVHHGNGTQDVFWERDDVLFFSTHQWPLYPGTGAASETGADAGKGTTVNVPMPAGCGDEEHLEVFETVLRPRTADFAPDIILVSAGFDSHALDPLGGMKVTTEGFAKLAGIIGELADQHCDGRVALFLEGGYSLVGLAESVAACSNVWR